MRLTTVVLAAAFIILAVIAVVIAVVIALCAVSRRRTPVLNAPIRALTFNVPDDRQHVYNPCVHDDGSVSLRLSTYNFCSFQNNWRQIMLLVLERKDLQVCVRVTSDGAIQTVEDAEDMRLVTMSDGAVGVFARRTPDRNAYRVCICTFMPVTTTMLRYAGASDIEKNWSPFVFDDTLYLSYSLNPHVVLRCDRRDGTCTSAWQTVNADLERETLRGGSQWIRLKHHYLCVCHRTDYVPELRFGRKYHHAFLLMQAAPPFRVLERSLWFRFASYFPDARDDIQFCTGLAAASDDSVRVSYGVSDCKGFETTLSLPYVARHLRMPILSSILPGDAVRASFFPSSK